MRNPNTPFSKLAYLVFFISYASFSSTLNENLNAYATTSKFQDSILYTEKVYLHFDKPYYAAGEIMWFKTYLVGANTNKPDAKSKIVHVELIDSKNKILNSRAIKISQGGGEGEFYLPKRLRTGEYTLRAYTNFMRNFDQSYFFIKKIKVRGENSLAENDLDPIKIFSDNNSITNKSTLKPDVQFFPEGGHMVTNKTSVIGFKAIGMDGKSISVSGIILDTDENEILNFETQKFGLGKFELTPETGKSYKALIQHNGNAYTYNLPQALEKGVTMEVIEYENEYQVILRSSLRRGVHRQTLTGLQNGKVVVVSQLTGSYKSGLIKIPKQFLEQGIIQLTVFDKAENPLCERLVFVDKDSIQPKVSISPAKTDYRARELVQVNIDLDFIQQANLSLAVTDLSVVNKEHNGLDIKSYLLLNSELKGEIEQPNYYFDIENKDRKELLDVLMLTQGWRQFLWNNTSETDTKLNDKKYPHEKGIKINGHVKNKSGGKKASAEVSLVYMNKKEFVEDKMRSSKDGQFSFGEYQFNDSTSVIIQAKNYKIKKRKKRGDLKEVIMSYNILLDTFTPHVLAQNVSYQSNSIDSTNLIDNEYMLHSKMERLNSATLFEEDYEQLDEANVTAIIEKKKEKFKNRNSIYNTPSYRADFDELPYLVGSNVLAALQGKMPGIRISGNVNNPIEGNHQIRITGGAITLSGGVIPPLILVDNFEVSDLSSIIADDVSYVDILTPARAAIYGSRAAGGVLSIHTKRGNEATVNYKKNRSGIINFIHPGYYKARKFYKPNYATKKPEHSKFDYRSTIHWQPTVNYVRTKKANISFYTADIPTTYRIDLQGISKEGLPIKKELYINVNNHVK